MAGIGASHGVDETPGVAVFVWTLLRYVADALPGLAWTVRVESRAASEHVVDAAP